jgi:hypothetical protein
MGALPASSLASVRWIANDPRKTSFLRTKASFSDLPIQESTQGRLQCCVIPPRLHPCQTRQKMKPCIGRDAVRGGFFMCRMQQVQHCLKTFEVMILPYEWLPRRIQMVFHQYWIWDTRSLSSPSILCWNALGVAVTPRVTLLRDSTQWRWQAQNNKEAMIVVASQLFCERLRLRLQDVSYVKIGL